MRPHSSLDRLKSAPKSDDQLQRRGPIAIAGGCRRRPWFPRHN